MIQINLLPVRASKKREYGRQQLILLGLLAVLAVIGNFRTVNGLDRAQVALVDLSNLLAEQFAAADSANPEPRSVAAA